MYIKIYYLNCSLHDSQTPTADKWFGTVPETTCTEFQEQLPTVHLSVVLSIAVPGSSCWAIVTQLASLNLLLVTTPVSVKLKGTGRQLYSRTEVFELTVIVCVWMSCKRVKLSRHVHWQIKIYKYKRDKLPNVWLEMLVLFMNEINYSFGLN